MQFTKTDFFCKFTEILRDSIDDYKQKIFNLNRDKILFSQTPQAFRFKELFDLQKKVSKKITDDVSLLIDDNKKVTVNISSEESSQELAGANF